MTPPPPRPSGSVMRNAKLLVPSGGFTQESCGETFSPRQFGLFGSFAGLLPTFFGIIAPSLNVVEDRLNSFSCAPAVPAMHERKKACARGRTRKVFFTMTAP